MPVPRAPGILGPHPVGPQAHLAAAPYQAGGGGHAPGGYAPGGYAPPLAPASFGYAPPPVPAQLPPAPWDPALLAALHSAPSPSNYGGGGDWYMDTGATAHMASHPGNLASSFPVTTSNPITFGDVKNLVSVRRLARDNPLTVEFDGLRFSVKDARTRIVLHRCDSPDDLYPVHSAATASPVALAAGVDLWRPILALQTDNDKEFDNAATRHLLASHGTTFRLTCPYTSQQNGRAERILRTLNDCVRTLLFHSNMPPRFWPDALATATLLVPPSAADSTLHDGVSDADPVQPPARLPLAPPGAASARLPAEGPSAAAPAAGPSATDPTARPPARPCLAAGDPSATTTPGGAAGSAPAGATSPAGPAASAGSGPAVTPGARDSSPPRPFLPPQPTRLPPA
nr:uncharacterized protein LOC109753949 [Aegilops tauschii subsp. strangulata]